MITSVENARIKELSKLNQAKYRKESKMFIVEGAHLVSEARAKGLLIEAFSTSDIEGYTLVSESVMKKLCNTSSVVNQIGVCKMMEANTLTDKLLILDRVSDPGNMGALMRSAKAFGFETIVLGEGCVDIYNDKVIRSSQGAIFKLNFINANLVEFIKGLKDYSIYGTNVINGVELDSLEKTTKLGIVLGNEGKGISKDVFDVIEKNIYIPMKDTESLNVSVAGSIIMYSLRG
jgi:TrmH family RNA methyltransferase